MHFRPSYINGLTVPQREFSWPEGEDLLDPEISQISRLRPQFQEEYAANGPSFLRPNCPLDRVMREKTPFPTVLITGASGGIGEAFAHVAAGEGHPLILVARTEAELHRVRGVVIARYAVPVTVIVLDLSKPGACDELANELEARKLAPDILINNAGFGLIGKAAELPRENQLQMIDLNVRALSDLTLRFLPAMIAKGSGGIINVASTAGFMPGPNMAVYFATKAYVMSFTEALFEETKGSGVTLTT
ncbi:MAG: SDR family NAD(P)-dependent oxidoreductase, partial [Alphaproteobacteria bacterium]